MHYGKGVSKFSCSPRARPSICAFTFTAFFHAIFFQRQKSIIFKRGRGRSLQNFRLFNDDRQFFGHFFSFPPKKIAVKFFSFCDVRYHLLQIC